jgi:hypothetical protein
MEKLPDALRMPLPLALNSEEEALLQDRLAKKVRRRFSADRRTEARASIGVRQQVEQASAAASRSQPAQRGNQKDTKMIKSTTMYHTFEASSSLEHFNESYKRQLAPKKRDVLGHTTSSLTNWTSTSMTNFSSTYRSERSEGAASQTRSKKERMPLWGGSSLPSIRSRPQRDAEDHWSFNAVSGRDQAMSGRDVRFKCGEANRILQSTTRHVKSPAA